jgi:hypothetical protein
MRLSCEKSVHQENAVPIRITAIAPAIILVFGLAAGGAQAQVPGHTAMPKDHAAHHAGMAAQPSGAVPTMPGQDAFGTVQEIVRILDADPKTDWSKVDIEALRQHLIDMNEVTLNVKSVATPVDGGARYEVFGEGRTLEAIRRMVPAHAREIDGVNGWVVRAEPVATGVVLTVTADDPRQALRLRGLGFIGIMAQGNHHQMHHLAMAKGQPAHQDH